MLLCVDVIRFTMHGPMYIKKILQIYFVQYPLCVTRTTVKNIIFSDVARINVNVTELD